MRALTRQHVLDELPLFIVIGAGVTAFAFLHHRIHDAFALVGWLAAAAIAWVRLRRVIRRRYASATLPDGVRTAIERLALYQRMPTELQQTLLRNCAWFLQESHIRAQDINPAQRDELMACAAFSATLVTLGLPDHEWVPPRSIVLLPTAFDAQSGELGASFEHAGQFQEQGPMLLAADELLEGFAHPDGYNVGIHEFAHALDWSSGALDGVPNHADPELASDWQKAIARLSRDRRRNRKLAELLDDGAYESEVEFLAYLSEYFFERPDLLNDAAPHLYALLVRMYRLDPLAWMPEDTRQTIEQWREQLWREERTAETREHDHVEDASFAYANDDATGPVPRQPRPLAATRDSNNDSTETAAGAPDDVPENARRPRLRFRPGARTYLPPEA